MPPRTNSPGILGLTGLALSACRIPPPVEFNEPPEAGTVSIEPSAPGTDDDLRAVLSVAPTDPDGDELTFTWRWTVDGTPATVGTEIVPADLTSRDETWTVEFVASDGEWDSGAVHDSVTILNTTPEVSAASLAPEEPATDDDLVLTATGYDPDGDPVTFRTAWAADGVEQPAWDDLLTLPASATARDEIWTVTFTPWDDRAPGAPGSLSVAIADSAPTLGSVWLSPTEPTAASTMAASLSNLQDADSDPLHVTVDWYVDDLLVETDALGPGSTTTTLSAALVRGQVVRVEATPTDETLVGETVVSEDVEVLNEPPTLDEVLLTPFSSTETSTLTCTPSGAFDLDGDEVSLVYDWIVGGTFLGLDQATLDGTWFDKGDTVQCEVVPTDGEDGEAVTSNSITIANSPPTFTGVTLSPASVTRASTVTATPTGWSDADGDTPVYAYSWSVNGSTVGGTSASLALSPYSRGSTVAATVSSSDGAASGPTISSSALTIQNSAPSISSASVSPSPAYAGSTLLASASGWSDLDGDSPRYTYAWTVDGAAVSGSTSTLSGCFVRGDRVQVTITPGDGYTTGSPRTSGTLTISNTSPVALAYVGDPQPVESCAAAQLSGALSSDVDGDPLTYAWSVTLVPGTSRADASFFDDPALAAPLFYVDAAGTWNFRVTVNDGLASSSDDVLMASEAPAGNTPPEADAGSYPDLALTTSCSATGYGVVCNPCAVDVDLDGRASSDADGDTLDFSWSAVSQPTGVRFTFDDDEAEQPVLNVGDLTTTFGVTEEYDITVDLEVRDCADGSDAAATVFTVSCTGI